AVGITGMVDVARRILQRLAINVVAVIDGKNVDVAVRDSAGAFVEGNLLPDVSKDPRPFLDSLRGKQSLSGNTGRTHTYLNFHSLLTFPYYVRAWPAPSSGGVLYILSHTHTIEYSTSTHAAQDFRAAASTILLCCSSIDISE